MHFEVLVEGQAELTTLSILFPKIIGNYDEPNTWRIHKHQGIGKLPENLSDSPNIKDRTLLHNFPSKLRAYAKSMSINEYVVLLLDLDQNDLRTFRHNILDALQYCDNKPNLIICFAIEELEAWFLGDREAIEKAFEILNPNAFDKYNQDSICGTWEVLANIIHPGGFTDLLKLGKRSVKILELKRIWAARITPNMDIDKNKSPSFNYFIDSIQNTIQ